MPIFKFYSPNCDSCLKVQPLLDQIQSLYQKNDCPIEIQSFNTLDEVNAEILAKYEIVKKQTLLPCLIFVDDKNKEIARLNGKIEAQALVENIDKLLESQGKKSPSLSFDLNNLEIENTNSKQDIADFIQKANQIKKDNPLDLSSDEDLSIAIMNLISIEEHLFFSANKTGNSQYYEIMKEVREVRKRSLKMIIKEYEGEVWCISKHLLATSMRLMEVGTKQLGQGKNELAQSLFADSYRMYLLFWGLNSGLIDSSKIDLANKDELAKSFEENVDCCKE